MKILILEDEIPAYQKLQACIKGFFKDNEPSSVQSDWARTNKDGKQFLAENEYDFILSDIQLLDGVSFDLFDPYNLPFFKIEFIFSIIATLDNLIFISFF